MRKIPHLQRTKRPCLSHKKLLERNFEKTQHGLHLQLLFYQLFKLNGRKLKIERVLILCIVVVLAKTCFKKFAPKIRRLVQQFTSIISQTFDCKFIQCIFISIFRNFDLFQRER